MHNNQKKKQETRYLTQIKVRNAHYTTMWGGGVASSVLRKQIVIIV